MKIKIILSTLLLGGLITGCYYDIVKPEDPNKPAATVSFSGDLQPLFNENCTTSGCHDGSSHDPALIEGESYNALKAGGFINTAIPEQSIIYIELNTGAMPTTGKLPSSDIQMVLNWIKQGAQNN
jgi:hypothetical protein